MKSLTLFIAAYCCALVTFGQSSGRVLGVLNYHAIPEDRYEGVLKSPYLFEEFVTATVHNTKKSESQDYLMNYNGHTGEFEFMYKGEKVELDKSYYDLIEVAEFTPSGDYSDKFVSNSVKFVKGLDPNRPGDFQIAIYSDDELSIYKIFDVRLAVREINDPARGSVEMKAFIPSFTYHSLKDGEIKSLRLNKRKVIEVLDNAMVASFIKKNKLKLDSEKDLREVLAYYDETRIDDSSEKVASNN